MKHLPPSQRHLNRVTDRERTATHEATKLYRVERAARRLIELGDRCNWAHCPALAGARLRLRHELEQVEGWSERFFLLKGDSHE
jgi:hypothetical protein